MAGPRYIADPASALTSVALDGLAVLFHAPSGMTHIVASPAPEILDALQQGPADAAELLRRLRARFEFDGDEAIHARLGELETAGLVRRA
jgi:PqqD family protein of HPr-rel-A system